MTLKEYVINYLPKRFGVHSAFSKVVDLIYLAELAGSEEFKSEQFESPRKRAELALPYQIKDLKERERVLNFLELIILKHRAEKHGENWDKRIITLQENTVFTLEEIAILADPRGFWGG